MLKDKLVTSLQVSEDKRNLRALGAVRDATSAEVGNAEGNIPLANGDGGSDSGGRDNSGELHVGDFLRLLVNKCVFCWFGKVK